MSNENRADAFLRGYLTKQFMASRRAPGKPKGRELQQYLVSYGHHVTVRSCQRYLAVIEVMQPMECAA